MREGEGRERRKWGRRSRKTPPHPTNLFDEAPHWGQVNGRRHSSAQYAKKKKKKKLIAWAVDPWCSFYHSFFLSLSPSLSVFVLKRSPRLMDPFVSSCLLWAGNSEAALEQHTCRLSPASSPLTTRSTQARLLWCFFIRPMFCDKHHISDRLELAAVIIFYYVRQTQRSHWGLVVLTISVFVGISFFFFFIKTNTASIKQFVFSTWKKELSFICQACKWRCDTATEVRQKQIRWRGARNYAKHTHTKKNLISFNQYLVARATMCFVLHVKYIASTATCWLTLAWLLFFVKR